MPRRPKPKVISWRRDREATLVVAGYGVRFFVDRRRLIVEDGFAKERRARTFSSGACRLQRIVVIGRTGFITLDALQWLADMGVALLLIGVGGRLTSVFTPGGLEGNKVRLHRVQATARDSEVGVQVAQMLIGKKLQGQLRNLVWLTDPGRQILIEDRPRHSRMQVAASRLEALCSSVQGLANLEQILMAERAGAELYWSVLCGLPLRWEPKVEEKVPSHWLTTQARESFRTGNRNGATDPTNALLNYGYALLEAETRIACLNAGLHPGLGIIHVDRDGRASFIYDLMESVRPLVDRLALEFVRTHVFTEAECHETREGFCRLDPVLAALITEWTTRIRPCVAADVREVTQRLAQLSRLAEAQRHSA